MAFIDGILQPGYFVKSLCKLMLFLAIPIIYSLFDKELNIKSLFRLNKSATAFSLCLGVVIYAVILGGYLLLRNVFDFSKIANTLGTTVGVTGKNFIFVSLYISFVNSLLEEFFFRGFAFLSLKRVTSRHYSYIFSALSFAIYHVAMMIGWFSWGVFALVMAGLFAGGLIFNFLNEKTGTVYPSWLVHMFSNFAINTVGFILFGII